MQRWLAVNVTLRGNFKLMKDPTAYVKSKQQEANEL